MCDVFLWSSKHVSTSSVSTFGKFWLFVAVKVKLLSTSVRDKFGAGSIIRGTIGKCIKCKANFRPGVNE